MNLTRHEVYLQAARARFGRSTAFRLGMEVGRAGATDLPNPYTHDRGRALYEDGVQCGLREREALAKQQEQKP